MLTGNVMVTGGPRRRKAVAIAVLSAWLVWLTVGGRASTVFAAEGDCCQAGKPTANVKALQALAGGTVYDGWDAAIATEGKLARNGDTDSLMYLDPFWPKYPTVKVFDPKLKRLWLRALGRPDVETKRRGADDIGRAHLAGMANLADTAGTLTGLLSDPHPLIVRISAARALVRLDARARAAELFDRNGLDGAEMILLTDPALAAWDHVPARLVWMQRLTGKQTARQVRVSAIRSLATVGHQPAAGALEKLALDDQLDPALRLVAARALGAIIHQGYEGHAQRLAGGPVIDRLVGASLLSHHSGSRTDGLLVTMAVDQEPSVAAIALRRLLEIDPLLIEPIGNGLLQRRDAGLRRLAAEAVFAQQTPAAIRVLAPLLNDDNPSLRVYVRRRLIVQDGNDQLRPVIRESVMRVLAHGDWRKLAGEGLQQRIKSEWRGLEQASMVSGAVDHEPAAGRLLDLLEYPRLEVRLAAAVALRRLQVRQVLPQMLDYATRITDWVMNAKAATAREPHIGWGIEEQYKIDEQISQLMQAFGQMRYRPAEPLMRMHIPKRVSPPILGPRARSGAIWALGYLYEDAPDDALAAQLAVRIQDMFSIPPEYPDVRRMCVITIGRMKAASQLGLLQRHFDMEFDNERMAPGLAWAIERISGVVQKKHDPIRIPQIQWFLLPGDSSDDPSLRDPSDE